MVSANHGNVTNISNPAVTSHNDHHTVDPNHQCPKITPTFMSENQFDSHIEEIDRELQKFDLPILNKEATSSSENHTLPKPKTHLPNCPMSSNAVQHSPFNNQPNHNLATSSPSLTQNSNPSPPPPSNTQTTLNLATTPLNPTHNPNPTPSQTTLNLTTSSLNPTQNSNPTLSPSPNIHTTIKLATSSPIPKPSPTWKRIPRAAVEHTPTEKVVKGTKRAFPGTQQQSKLPKKRHGFPD